MACRETTFADKQDLKTPIETHYETFGQGEPILIINGGPVSIVKDLLLLLRKLLILDIRQSFMINAVQVAQN
ncbi:MAG: hypothetical protein IPF67_10735 [Saprospiraceae bacterium]|nr:hypothetical protein [Candidatus Brachybacter algidus]